LAALIFCGVLFTTSEVASGDLFGGVLSYVGRQPLPVVVGLSLVSAGSSLRLREPDSKTARIILGLGAALLLLLYLLPQRGQPFVLDLFTLISTVVSHGSSREIFGSMYYWLIDLFPLIIALFALWGTRRDKAPGVLLAPMARYGLAGLVTLASYQLIISGFGLDAVLYQIRNALFLAICVALTAKSIDTLTQHLMYDRLPPVPGRSTLVRDILLRAELSKRIDRSSSATQGDDEPHPLVRLLMNRRLYELSEHVSFPPFDPLHPDPEEASSFRDRLNAGEDAGPTLSKTQRALCWFAVGPVRLSALLVAISLVGLGAYQWKVYTPPPNLEWKFTTPSAQDKKIFSDLFPSYVIARNDQDHYLAKGQQKPHIEERVRTRSNALIDAARALDPELSERILSFVRLSENPDFSGRLWMKQLRKINERIREIGLPYYVQGNYMQMSKSSEMRRIFFVKTFYVERLRRFTVDGQEVASIHLRSLDRVRFKGRWLGLVRGDMPFALIMLDQIEKHSRALFNALNETASCNTELSYLTVEAIDIDAKCGSEILNQMRKMNLDVDNRPEEAFQAILERNVLVTERHELQHLVDGDDLESPLALYELIPAASDDQVSLAMMELSAQTCELATDDGLQVLLSLANQHSFLLSDRVHQTPYLYSSGLIAESLTDQNIIETYGSVKKNALLSLWDKVHALGTADGNALAQWASKSASKIHRSYTGRPCPTYALKIEQRPTDMKAR